MSKSTIRALLGDRPIAYHPILARVTGSAAGTILLGQLLYWDGYYATTQGEKWDGWFYKSADALKTETGLTRSEFETARRNLLSAGLVETDLRGVPATTYYRVNLDAIESKLDAALQTSLPKHGKLVYRDTAGKFAETRQSIYEIEYETEYETTTTTQPGKLQTATPDGGGAAPDGSPALPVIISPVPPVNRRARLSAAPPPLPATPRAEALRTLDVAFLEREIADAERSGTLPPDRITDDTVWAEHLDVLKDPTVENRTGLLVSRIREQIRGERDVRESDGARERRMRHKS